VKTKPGETAVETIASAAQAAKPDNPTLAKLKERYPQKDAAKLETFATTIDQHEKAQKEPVAWIVTGDNRLLVFRRPDQDEWEEAGEKIRAGERVAVVNRSLALKTVLEPKQDDLPEVFKRWPGLHARIGDALTVLVGADEGLTAKKD
jgi:hypothetical protein